MLIDFLLNLIRIEGVVAEDIVQMEKAVRIYCDELDADPFRV